MGTQTTFVRLSSFFGKFPKKSDVLTFCLFLSIFLTGLTGSTGIFAQESTAVVEAPENDPNEPEYYFRVSREGEKQRPSSFDAAIAHFSNGKTGKEELRVDLISAVHIGDKEYYAELNKRFTEYEVVLFELVASKEMMIEELSKDEKKNKSALGAIQGGFGKLLKLDFQMEHIDYTAKNMVHADMDAETFFKRFQEDGGLLGIILKAYRQALNREEAAGEGKVEEKLVASLFAKDTSLALKRLVAEEMQSSLRQTELIFGDDSLIIDERNECCLKVLRKEIAAGKKRIAIFYGGAHNPAFSNSLQEEFGMSSKVDRTWVVAWDLTANRSARKEKTE